MPMTEHAQRYIGRMVFKEQQLCKVNICFLTAIFEVHVRTESYTQINIISDDLLIVIYSSGVSYAVNILF